jgi:hypothetical protein
MLSNQTLAPSVVNHSDEKGRHFMRNVGTAYDVARLSEEEAQRVNMAPGLSALIGKFIAENRRGDRFKNEEVASNYTYPVEYTGPKPLVAQIKALAKTLGINSASAIAYAKELPKLEAFVPADMLAITGWFAFSATEALASLTSLVEDEEVSLEEQYCRGVNFILGKLGESRSFYNYREGQIVPARLRQLERTLEGLTLLSEMQGGNDILVAPFQLGMGHRGCSTRRARERFVGNEYGGTSIQGGCIALTHPERFVRWEELDMDLPGDEFDDPGSDVRFAHAPCLRFDGELRFGARRVGDAAQGFGSASWFLPPR